jgi:exo-1,4-beta-D-glucosaminidase
LAQKKACEPIHVMYSYDDRSVAVVNSTYQAESSLTVTARLFDSSLHERFSVTVPVDVPADGVVKAGAFPERVFDPPSAVYFVDLVLKDNIGNVLSTNFYWLSAKRNLYDWSAEDNDAFTPVKSYEDLTALQSVPGAGKIHVEASVLSGVEGPLVKMTLQNGSGHLALQIQLGIRRKNDGADILPVLWSDNYISLVPGESREITAQFLSPDVLGSDSELSVAGWNIDPETVPLSDSKTSARYSGAWH